MSGITTDQEGMPVVPCDKVHPRIVYLKNAGSQDMGVDGSVSTINFDAGPTASTVWYVYKISLVIQDSELKKPEKFGRIGGGLTNGFNVQTIISSTTRNVTDDPILNNIELGTFFDLDWTASDDSLAADDPVAFFNHKFAVPVKLDGDNTDLFRAQVQDDLTDLDYFFMLIHAYEVVS